MAARPEDQRARATEASATHQHREVAESFGSDAARYDRARPSYPGALIDRIIAGSPGADVLDVGCGTGIAARQFQAAGCRVLGVDPDPRVADLTRIGATEPAVTRRGTFRGPARQARHRRRGPRSRGRPAGCGS
ncbi:MAG TPA: methyltransferase domain-containing protein [Streptosporangiaceae bacterium]|nr:methyltransferase domain-containing protein [Streptosporangiaceae bacterium]